MSKAPLLIKEAILRHAGYLFCVRPHDITGPDRSNMFIPARFAVCKALRNRGWSFGKIGRLLNRDHTTIINAVERADYMETRDPAYAAKVKELTELQILAPKELRNG